MTPKISVVIPVYNVEKYIQKCLDSIVNQIFKDIEIICINDCSSDNSLEILNEYSKKDSRVVVIDKVNNQGTMLARKSGVEAAKGEYIIFIDADDYIDTNLCQFISDITEKEDADIIHFSSGVYNDISDERNEEMEKALEPLEKVLTGDEILEYAFIKKLFATQLWGKVFKSDLCKKACSVLPEENCYVGEDVFTTFILCCFAKKYIGIKTPDYYFYRFGIGVSGQNMINISKFEMFAKMSNWVKYASEYLDNIKANKLQLEACASMKYRLFADCCEIYRLRVSEKDKIYAEDLIYKYWNCFDINEDVWLSNIGKSKEYIKKQYEICEYYKPASSYENSNAKVSIVVYIHNNADVLERNLKVILKQSLQSTEYILINDGSDDDSLQIINEYADMDDRITVINQKYKGLSVASNKALIMAKGEYIYFADISKGLDTNFIEKAYEDAKRNNAEIVSFDGLYKEICVSGEKFLIESVKNKIYSETLSTKLFNTDFIKQKKIFFNETIKNSNEIFFVMLAVQAENIFCSSELILKDYNDDKINFTAEDFIENFIIYTYLSASSIVSSYSEIAKKAISDICKRYYNISNNIYINLSNAQADKINKILPEEYKPLFFNTRELRNIKVSATYKYVSKLISIPSKLLNRK